jgi:hypothetical protein
MNMPGLLNLINIIHSRMYLNGTYSLATYLRSSRNNRNRVKTKADPRPCPRRRLHPRPLRQARTHKTAVLVDHSEQ